MNIRRAMPVIRSADVGASRAFWVDFLGFTPGMDDPGFLMLKSPSVETTQVIVADPTTPDDRIRDVDVSLEVDSVEDAYADAQQRGLEIVYPLTDEPWGVRRFFVRSPDGTVVNVASHRPAE